MDYAIRELEVRAVYGQGTKFSGLFLNLNEAEITNTLRTATMTQYRECPLRFGISTE